jgi:DNA invertase Pin-like site-specific DNA recombinase
MPKPNRKHVAVYARVSTVDQNPENQLQELRRYIAARGWKSEEFVDRGISGSREKRPALDRILGGVTRKKFDAVVVWKLDGLGRSTTHLLGLLNQFRALGVDFVTLSEGLDTTTPTGELMFTMLGAFAQFERSRTIERIHLGLERARRQGKKLGRRPSTRLRKRFDALPDGTSVMKAAETLSCSTATIQKLRAERRTLHSA